MTAMAMDGLDTCGDVVSGGYLLKSAPRIKKNTLIKIAPPEDNRSGRNRHSAEAYVTH